MDDKIILDISTLQQLITEVVRLYGDKTAFMWEKGDKVEKLSYKEFGQIVEANANRMYKEFGADKCIALVGENSVEWLAAYFAIVCSGNTAVPLEPDGSIENTVSNLKRCDACAILHDEFQTGFAANVAKELSGELKLQLFEELSERKPLPEDWSSVKFDNEDVSPEHTAAIVFTSGTTGKSKGIKLTNKNICKDVQYCCEALYLEGRTVTILPFHHMYAITTSICMSMCYGIEMVICPSAKKAFKLTSVYKPNCLFVVPMILGGLCKKIAMEAAMSKTDNYRMIKEKILGDNFTFCISGGAILSKDLRDLLEKFEIKVYNGYGITECSPVVSVHISDDMSLNSTVGNALPNVEVCIMNKDENGEGEICVKGDIVMSGYLNDPEATKETFYGEWFRTGDIGKLDEGNRICITGRCKNLIILSNGKNVSPEEIEEKLQLDPMVQEIIVYAKNDSIIAAVYPTESDQEIDYQAYFNRLVNDYNANAPLYKKISRVEVLDKPFERTATGKIKRNYFNS